ncbi:MAG: peptidase M22, partial [Acutalibacteraceae bacterium]
MSVSFGLDTSNYTTSAALYDSGNGKYVNSRRLLEVDAGNVGLRQSDALFKHIKNLPEIVRSAFSDNKKEIDAVGVSDRPRSAPGSYMPC